jgi:hypothetical protein
VLVAVPGEDRNGLVEAESRLAALQRTFQPLRSYAGDHPLGTSVSQTATLPPPVRASRAAVQALVWSLSIAAMSG